MHQRLERRAFNKALKGGYLIGSCQGSTSELDPDSIENHICDRIVEIGPKI